MEEKRRRTIRGGYGIAGLFVGMISTCIGLICSPCALIVYYIRECLNLFDGEIYQCRILDVITHVTSMQQVSLCYKDSENNIQNKYSISNENLSSICKQIHTYVTCTNYVLYKLCFVIHLNHWSQHSSRRVICFRSYISIEFFWIRIRQNIVFKIPVPV